MHKQRNLIHAAGAGLICGVAATLTMTAVNWACSVLRSPSSKHVKDPRKTEAQANAAVAREIIHAVTGRHLQRRDERRAAAIVQYSYGSALGALYAASAEFVPALSSGYGSAFGLATWLFEIEVGLPAMGLARHNPRELIEHSLGAVGHVAWGISAEVTRRLLLR